MRLIDADHLNELLKKISKKYDEEGDLDACVIISEVLGVIHLDAPTIEAERHGHWIMLHKTHNTGGDNDYDWRCSECNHVDCHNISVEVPYCWYCGAKMDAKGEE